MAESTKRGRLRLMKWDRCQKQFQKEWKCNELKVENESKGPYIQRRATRVFEKHTASVKGTQGGNWWLSFNATLKLTHRVEWEVGIWSWPPLARQGRMKWEAFNISIACTFGQDQLCAHVDHYPSPPRNLWHGLCLGFISPHRFNLWNMKYLLFYEKLKIKNAMTQWKTFWVWIPASHVGWL